MSTKQLQAQLEQYCENFFSEIDPMEIFQRFVTNQKKFLQFLERSQQKSKICMKQILDGELAFQCFTCSSNEKHYICYECFDTTKHINHQCIINPNEGFCDCGNPQRMNIEGHCENHRSSLEEESEPILSELALCIENFIQAAISLYTQKMNHLSKEYQKYDQQIIYFYLLANGFGIKSLTNIIEQNFNLNEYFSYLCKTSFLHRTIITFLEWLAIDKPNFQQLLIQILSNNQIYETLISQQSLLEVINVCVDTQPIQQLLDILCLNQKFKEFVIKTNLASSNWIVIESSYSQYKQQIVEVRISMSDGDEEYDKQQIKEIGNLLKQYIKDIKKPQQLQKTISTNQINTWQLQNCDEFLMNIFMKDRNSEMYFRMMSTINKEIHSPNKLITQYPFQEVKFFQKLCKTTGFEDAAFNQLSEVLGLQFQSFTSQPTNNCVLKKFEMNDFVITAFINSLSDAKPITISEFNGDFVINDVAEKDYQEYLTYQEEILRITIEGIGIFLNSPQSTLIFRMNFIQLLLVKCYYLIKEKRNNYPSIEQEIQLAFAQYLKIDQDEDQFLDRHNKILLLLLKNATFIDKLFINLLWIDYSSRLFQEPQQMRDYLLALFEESSIDNIKVQFQRVLERCIQTNISCKCMIGLQQIYQGEFEFEEEEDNIPRLSLESFDLAFMKMYLFLFDGLNDVKMAMNNLQLPDLQLNQTIFNQNLLRILQSDVDIYNICYLYFHKQQELPSIIHQVFAGIIQNIFNFLPFCIYSTVELRFNDLFVMHSQESKRHILKICELEASVTKLKLKQEYKQKYDPLLFQYNIGLRADLVGRLTTRGLSSRILLYGDGLEWTLNCKKFSPVQKYLLFSLSSTEIINNNLLLIQKLQLDSYQTFQLIFTQIMAAQYFRGEELSLSRENIIQQLENIIKIQTIDEEYTTILLKMIINQDYFQDISPNIPINDNRQQQKKLQYQNKFIKSQQFYQEKITNKEICCSYCLIPLNENKYVTPILITLKTKSENFSHLKQPENIPYDSILPLLNINSCAHHFHAECIEKQFQLQSYNCLSGQFPDWFKLNCPICIQACNILMPMQQNIEKQDIINFNVALLNLINNLKEAGLTKYTLTRHQGNQLNSSIDVYLQLMDDLIFQMLIDFTAFKRQKKDQIFKQIYNLFIKFINSQKVNGKFQETITTYVFNEDVSLSQRILKQLQLHMLQSSTSCEAQVQIEISKIVKELEGYPEIAAILIEVFDIKHDMLEGQAMHNQKINEEIIKHQEMKRLVFDKIIFVLGKTFKDFYHRYFPQKCYICKFYAINYQESADINVCLLCSKVICSGKCSETQLLGNLNQHALQEHEGNSIYVSMVWGSLNLVYSPFSIQRAKIIYPHKHLGQAIYQFDKNEKWSDFIIDENRVWELAEVILTNSYQTKFKNLQVTENQVNMLANI